MANQPRAARVAFITSNEGIEEAELVEPWKAVEKAGGQPVLIAKEAGEAQAFNHLDPAGKYPVDQTTKAAKAEDFDGLVLPGGVTNGDQVRTDPEAVRLVQEFTAAGKPIAVVCHGGWVLVEADLVRGRTMTSWPSLQTDIRNAGGTWVDQELQVCEQGPNRLISSRQPDDLPAFNSALVDALAEVAAHSGS